MTSVRRVLPRPDASLDPSPSARASTRTCVGCRGTADRTELLRLVVRPGDDGPAVVPDPRRRMPGRGANIHLAPACLALAHRRKAFGRAFKVATGLDIRPLEAYLAAAGHSSTSTSQQTHTESGSRTQ